MIYVLAGAPHHAHNMMLMLGIPQSRYLVTCNLQTLNSLGRQDVLFIETDSVLRVVSGRTWENQIECRKRLGLQVCPLSLSQLLGERR